MHALCDLLPNGGSLTIVDVHGWCVSNGYTIFYWKCPCLKVLINACTHTHTHTHKKKLTISRECTRAAHVSARAKSPSWMAGTVLRGKVSLNFCFFKSPENLRGHSSWGIGQIENNRDPLHRKCLGTSWWWWSITTITKFFRVYYLHLVKPEGS